MAGSGQHLHHIRHKSAMDERNSALCEDFNDLAAHQCIIFISAQAIATTRTRITSQNLIGISASLRCLGVPGRPVALPLRRRC